MNTELNPNQSDTKAGSIVLPANVDLTGKENYLLKIVNSSGKAQFALPTAVTDLCPFICDSGDIAGNDSYGEGPSLAEDARVVLKGTCIPGDVLVLAVISGSDAGKVRTATGAGTLTNVYSPGIAEEAGVDGQHVKFRPLPQRWTQ